MNKIKAYRVTSRTYPEDGPIYLVNVGLFFELAGGASERFLVEELVIGLPSGAECGDFDPKAATQSEPLIDVAGVPYTLDELMEVGGAKVLAAREYTGEVAGEGEAA